MNNQEVLAVIAGKEITEQDFQAFLTNSVPRDQQRYARDSRYREHYLDQMIHLHLFAEYGKELKLEETEEFQRILENAKRDLYAQMAMSHTFKEIVISDEEAKAFYDENQQQFTKPETVNAKHILVEDEDTCKEILAIIESGERTFEEEAADKSTCPSCAQGGSLGEFGRGQMVKEFEDAAFAAEVGVIAGPVKTQFGYHLIKLESKKEASVTPFEDARTEINNVLAQKKQAEVYEVKVGELKNKYMNK